MVETLFLVQISERQNAEIDEDEYSTYAIDLVTDNERILASERFETLRLQVFTKFRTGLLKWQLSNVFDPLRTRYALTMEFFREYGKFKD